jgi:hypothetical protein
MIFLMHGHLDLKKSHFDSRNQVPDAGRDKTKVGGKVGTQTTDQFPFLDMELSWSVEGTLKFGVHLKLNQQLNAGSAHTPGYFKAIMTGVCYRLTKLTTIDENSADMKHDKIYPEHFSALSKADLLKFFDAPTLGAKAAELNGALEDEVGQATKRGEKETEKEQSISKWV